MVASQGPTACSTSQGNSFLSPALSMLSPGCLGHLHPDFWGKQVIFCPRQLGGFLLMLFSQHSRSTDQNPKPESAFLSSAIPWALLEVLVVMKTPCPDLLSASPDGSHGGTSLLTLSGLTHVGFGVTFFGTHQLGITSVIQNEVLWLEVPINDPFGMQVGKGFHHARRVKPGGGILK